MPEAPKENNNIKIIENATCTFCGCVCDDQILHVDTKENKIVKTLNSCVLGKAWFAEHYLDTSLPECLIDGKKATYEEGITEAARVLTDAKFPIVYGLSDTTSEAQREAVAIADWVGGNLDTTTSVCHGPSGIAFEGVGESTSTLGEMKNRSDVVVFWGGNPAESHPRLFPHYVGTPKGRFTPNGRDDRIFILADTRTTPSRRFLREEEKGGKDIFLQIKPGKDFEVLWTLRALVKGKKVSNYNEEETGIPFKTLEKIRDIVLKAKYPTFLFGMGLTMTRGRHFNSGAVLALATDLNGLPGKKNQPKVHAVAKPVRGHGNVTGADNVVSWSTGYPFGINFSKGYPIFNPGEFTTTDLLSRGEADAALIIASDPASNYAKPAIEHLHKIPVITLDPKPSHTSKLAHVAFTTATYGINVEGTVYRMDDVPITTRPAFESPYKSDEEILSSIKDRIRETLSKNGNASKAAKEPQTDLNKKSKLHTAGRRSA